ncbi:hypothetical protein A9Q94_11920 [Rhodobacterales bacterium 56_14_T64]|nr:hypothetical protein A9Q94_11920 [Rhodobacterales bacterium 56_14_T64]
MHGAALISNALEKPCCELLSLGLTFDVSDLAEALVVARYRKELMQFRVDLAPLTEAPRVFVYDSGEDMPFKAGR